MKQQLKFLLKQAIDSYRSGNFDRANSILTKLIKVDSKNWTALHIQGLIKAAQANYLEAAELFSQAAHIQPSDPMLQYNLAKALADCGRLDEALLHHQKSIELAPNNPDAWLNFGKTLLDLGKFESSLINFERTLNLKPDYAEGWINKGNALHQLSRYDEALICYDQAIHFKPSYGEAYSNKGKTLNALFRFDESIAEYDRALNYLPDKSEIWVLKAEALHNINKYDEALLHYDHAIKLKPNLLAAWFNKGNILFEIKRYEEALICYDHALSLKIDFVEVICNKANTLRELKKIEESITCFDHAIRLKPDFHEAWFNKGNVLYELNQYDEALKSYNEAIKINPNFAEVYSNRGSLLSIIKNHQDAATSFFKAAKLGSKIKYNLGKAHHQMMMICNWSGYDQNTKNILNGIENKEQTIDPFALMATTDSLKLIKDCTENYIHDNFRQLNFHLKKQKNKSKKIRLGYLSGEFRNQATSYLLSEVWELHDRTKFEIFAFDNGFDDDSKYRQRIKLGFNNLIQVSSLSDLDATKLIEKNEIDILINLNGFFGMSRTGVFSHRAAPIQVNYLGYPGTMGASYIDYIIADSILIPPELQQYYTEKVVYLPDSYQANDRKREISNRKFTRAEVGLPDNSFVYCCFNNNYKILPEVFEIWMRLLNTVERSVLWLLEDNPTAAKNLKSEAAQRGIDPGRLIFAPRLPTPDHLARHALADLFIDTFPYNAHTTASDALWAGLPLLTVQGESFASRVASSLLSAIGLTELITYTLEEYETLAIELANNQQKLKGIRHKLAQNRDTTPLFDTPQFTKHLENAYLQMYERYQADLPPEHIFV
jgi:predicted O-linked N-acetylglucosamine transferase (SPINDLY family)